MAKWSHKTDNHDYSLENFFFFKSASYSPRPAWPVLLEVLLLFFFLLLLLLIILINLVVHWMSEREDHIFFLGNFFTPHFKSNLVFLFFLSCSFSLNQSIRHTYDTQKQLEQFAGVAGYASTITREQYILPKDFMVKFVNPMPGNCIFNAKFIDL